MKTATARGKKRARALSDPLSMLKGIQAATASLLTAESAEEAAQLAVAASIKVMGASAGFVARYEPEMDHFRLMGLTGSPAPPSAGPFPLLPAAVRTPLGVAFQTQQSRWSSSAVELRRDFSTAPSRLAAGMEATADLPMTTPRGRYGVFCLAFSDVRSFTPEEIELMETFANLCAQALERAELFDETRSQAERLKIANAAKDEFLGLVSHELRTPITMILGNATILSNPLRGFDENTRRESVLDIQREAERLAQIVENLLVLARLDSGKGPDREPVLMLRLVEQILEETRRRYSDRSFELEASSENIVVLANSAYIQLVLRNYLGNAVKYAPPNQAIGVKVGQEAEEGIVTVLDRGPGIAEDEIAAIFEPFYRSPSNPGHISGVGIGLSVCRNLIGALGGRVWASQRKGGGSEFHFALPLFAEAGAREILPTSPA